MNARSHSAALLLRRFAVGGGGVALITCPDCQKEISDRAPACIHCGRPLEEKDSSEEILRGERNKPLKPGRRVTVKRNSAQLPTKSRQPLLCPICGDDRSI